LELQAPEPLLLAAGKDKTPAELVLWAFEKIPLADIEEALMSVPIPMVSSLLTYIIDWFQSRLDVVLASRVLTFLLKVHHNQIIADDSLRIQLETLRAVQIDQLRAFKDTVGFNVVALKAIIHDH
jgi:U3 small nucleolar RNA-associated protein 12